MILNVTVLTVFMDIFYSMCASITVYLLFFEVREPFCLSKSSALVYYTLNRIRNGSFHFPSYHFHALKHRHSGSVVSVKDWKSTSPSCFKAAADTVISRRRLSFKLGMASARQCAVLRIEQIGGQLWKRHAPSALWEWDFQFSMSRACCHSHVTIFFISRELFDVSRLKPSRHLYSWTVFCVFFPVLHAVPSFQMA